MKKTNIDNEVLEMNKYFIVNIVVDDISTSYMNANLITNI